MIIIPIIFIIIGKINPTFSDSSLFSALRHRQCWSDSVFVAFLSGHRGILTAKSLSQISRCVCLKMGYIPNYGCFNGENCYNPMDFGVHYFQTNPGVLAPVMLLHLHALTNVVKKRRRAGELRGSTCVFCMQHSIHIIYICLYIYIYVYVYIYIYMFIFI